MAGSGLCFLEGNPLWRVKGGVWLRGEEKMLLAVLAVLVVLRSRDVGC